jgi:hypothetical protein
MSAWTQHAALRSSARDLFVAVDQRRLAEEALSNRRVGLSRAVGGDRLGDRSSVVGYPEQK